MLDPKLIKEKSQMIRDMLKSRSVDFDLDGLIESDQKRRELIIKTDELRKKKNQLALQISQKKKSGEEISSVLTEMKGVSEDLGKLESEQEDIEKNIPD